MELLEGAKTIINELQLTGWKITEDTKYQMVLVSPRDQYVLIYRRGIWDEYERDYGWWTLVGDWKSDFSEEDPVRPLEEFLVWWKALQQKQE